MSSGTLNDDHSPNELRKAAMAGRRCTWAKLSAIHASCGIELMLDEYINELHRQERHALHREEDDGHDPGAHQSSELEPGTATTTPGDGDSELPLEQQITPGYGTPSEAETEDYLLDHLCSCAGNTNPESRRCDAAHTVADQVQLVEECDTVEDSGVPSPLFGDTAAWSGEPLYDSQPEQDGMPSSPSLAVESVCEQYRLGVQSQDLEWDVGYEDSHGSPTTVLQGPRHLRSRKVSDRVSHPGCKLQSYFEEMSNSSSNPDDDI